MAETGFLWLWNVLIWGCWVYISIPNTDLLFQQHLKIWLFWLLLVRISFVTVTWTWDAFEIPTSRQGAVCCIRPQGQGQLQGVIQKPRLLLQKWIFSPKFSSTSIQALGKLVVTVELQPGGQHTTPKCQNNIWSQNKVEGLIPYVWTS